MTVHEHGPLTFSQQQTPANQVSREAARAGIFPGPIVPSQQFSIQGGLAQLNSRESAQLEKVVNRLRKQNGPAAGFAIGRAFSR